MEPHLEAFKQALIADGYLDVELKTLAPNHKIPMHSHPWDVRALVVAGSAVIGCEGEAPREYRPGDVLVVAADVPHFEDYGPEGYTFLVGRRREPPVAAA